MRKHILIPLIIRSNYTNIREQKRNIERNTKNLEIYPMQKKKNKFQTCYLRNELNKILDIYHKYQVSKTFLPFVC